MYHCALGTRWILVVQISIPKSGKYTIRIRAASGQPGRVVALDLLAPQFPPSLVASDTAALSRTKAFGYRVASLGEDDTSDDGDNHGHEEEYQYSHGERILIDSKPVTIPGLDGWQDYYDLVWESIELEPNVYTLQVTSETGKANLCSVAIFEVSFRWLLYQQKNRTGPAKTTSLDEDDRYLP